ncbi:MAG: hypothetical protein ACPGUD_10935 [Parashewanella sp.]
MAAAVTNEVQLLSFQSLTPAGSQPVPLLESTELNGKQFETHSMPDKYQLVKYHNDGTYSQTRLGSSARKPKVEAIHDQLIKHPIEQTYDAYLRSLREKGDDYSLSSLHLLLQEVKKATQIHFYMSLIARSNLGVILDAQRQIMLVISGKIETSSERGEDSTPKQTCIALKTIKAKITLELLLTAMDISDRQLSETLPPPHVSAGDDFSMNILTDDNLKLIRRWISKHVKLDFQDVVMDFLRNPENGWSDAHHLVDMFRFNQVAPNGIEKSSRPMGK